MSNIYDVLIVGAGPAGSSTAYQLAKQGVRVLLLDKLDFPRDKACGDALSPRALRVLNEMNLLDDIWQIGRCVNTLKLIAPTAVRQTIEPLAYPRLSGFPFSLTGQGFCEPL